MKQPLRWLGTLLAAVLTCCFSPAAAQTYVPDEDNPLITTVSPTGETQLTSNCTWVVTDENNDNNLPENNRAFYSKGDYLGTLIDGSTSTYWHSDPTGMNLNTQDEWIQIDFQRDDIQKFYLMIMRREDNYNGTTRYGVTPVKLQIKASNTPDDDGLYNDITVITDIPPASTNGVWPYYKLIDLGKAYRYVRLYCRQASTNEGEAMAYWTFSELQAYPQKIETDMHKLLQAVVDSIYDRNTTYNIGTDPGCVTQEAKTAFDNTFSAVLDVNDKQDLSNDEYAKAMADLRQACEKLNASVVPLGSGWFFIRSNNPAFYTSTNTYRNMYGGTDGKIYWKTADENDAYQYFIVKKLENGNYLIQNAYDKKYINTGAGDARYNTGIHLFSSAKAGAEQVLTPSEGGFYISNTENALPYHPHGHNNGAGQQGEVVPASVYEIASTWRFIAADSTKFASLTDVTAKQEKANELLDEMGPAILKSFEMKAPDSSTGLITAGSQLTSSNPWGDSYRTHMEWLLDGDHGTHYHSDAAASIFTTDEYLQADLGRDDVTSFTIEYWGRNDGAASGNEWHDNPTKFVVKATNAPDDESSWVDVTTISSGFPANMHNAHYASLPVTTDTPYRYYRFYVKATSSNNPYWNLSEFQLYEKVTPTAKSKYSTMANVKTLVDALDADIAAAAEHIKNLTVDGTEIAPINEKLAQLQKILDDQEKIKKVVADAKTLDNSLYAWSEDGYIKEVNTKNDGTNQLSSNATWTTIAEGNDNYSFNKAFILDGYNLLGTLIDKDDQTYWHSDPTGGNNLYAQENYLQIDLKQSDVKAFRIRVDRRNDLYQGSNRHGVTPTKAIIYGTNDDAVGTDVSGACSNWTEITTLTDFPADKNDASLWPYISDDITPATPYRYLRFRVTADIDGQPYWTISGFQILEAGDGAYNKEASQYFHVEGMKDAADKMMAATDALQAKLDAGTATIDDTKDVLAAMEAVRALYQDTTALSKTLATATALVPGITTGEDPFCYAEDKADAFNKALEEVNAARPFLNLSQAEITRLDKALSQATSDLLASMVSPDSTMWYTLKVADNYAVDASGNYLVGQIAYNNSDEPEGVLCAGGDESSKLEDPRRAWKFLPTGEAGIYNMVNCGNGWSINNGKVRLVPLGNEQFAIQTGANLDATFYINSSSLPTVASATGITAGVDSTGAWMIQDAPEELTQTMNVNIGRVYSLCFPFETYALPEATDGTTSVETYKVCGYTLSPDGTTITGINLTKWTEESIPAATPFVIKVGGDAEYSSTKVAVDFKVKVNGEVTRDMKPQNGLYGTFRTIALPANMVYFTHDYGLVEPKDFILIAKRVYLNVNDIKNDATASVDRVVPVNGTILAYDSLLSMTSYNVKRLTAGTHIGEFPEDALNAYKQTVEPLLSTIPGMAAGSDEATQARQTIVDAYNKLYATMVKPESGKWYTFATADIARTGMLMGAGGPSTHLYGLKYSYVLCYQTYGQSASEMRYNWAVTEDGNGRYILQNVNAGGYFGPYTGSGDAKYDKRPILWYEPKSFSIIPLGDGQVALQTEEGYFAKGTASWGAIGLDYTKDYNGYDLHDNGYGWIMEPTEDNHAESTEYDTSTYPGNVVALSKVYALDGLPKTSEGETIQGYDIVGKITNDEGAITAYKLKALPADAVIPAGKPVVYIVPGERNTAATTKIVFKPKFNSEIKMTRDTVNGLVSNHANWATSEAGINYFANDAIAVAEQGAVISRDNAFVVPSLIEDVSTDDPDAIFYVDGSGIVNGIAATKVAGEDQFVDVYTIDGQLVRKHVDAAKATNGLDKGIYIVGKKKVLVK